MTSPRASSISESDLTADKREAGELEDLEDVLAKREVSESLTVILASVISTTDLVFHDFAKEEIVSGLFQTWERLVISLDKASADNLDHFSSSVIRRDLLLWTES